MRLLDTLSLSVRTFRTRPMRTALTILGMGVGIGAVLFLVSFGYGLQQVILNQITTADSLLSLDVSTGSSGLIEIDGKAVEEISKMEHVEEVSPALTKPGQIETNDIRADSTIFAIDKSFFRLNGVLVDHGDEFSSNDAKEVIISSISMNLFDYEEAENIIGKEVTISVFLTKTDEDDVEEVQLIELAEKYRVVGVIEDESSNYVFLPLHTIHHLEINSYDQLKVKVSSDEYIEEVRGKIIDRGYIVSALSDTIDQARKIFRIVQIILGLFGLIALIVSAIGMFNTMTITLLERINEIGIMRSIGVTRRDVQNLFLVESMLIGFLGGLSGIAIGYLSGEAVNVILNLLAKNFGGQSLDIFYSPGWFVVFILVFSTVIGIATGIYPSRRAGSLNPLDALRYK